MRIALALTALATAVFAVGGYFESQPFAVHMPDGSARRYPLAVIYWSGDMGVRLGYGNRIIEALRAGGTPVLSVSSPALFGRARDRAFVDDIVAKSIAAALAQTGAERIAMVGSSFGADIIGSGLASVAPELRQRIASVVLLAPGRDVYFHANPSGMFYRGPVAADPSRTIPALHGLPVTCISGADERASLCRAPIMAGARRISIDGGHMMLFSHAELTEAVEQAVRHPPPPMH